MGTSDDLRTAIVDAYDRLCARLGREPELAVRSSATAEDLPEASFAGQAESFLNVRGREGLMRAVHACYSSLFTDRAINYRARLGYDQLKVALSVGVMPIVRSDKGSSGVAFTLDTESGFRDVVTITGSYGLGEFVVQGVVIPDETQREAGARHTLRYMGELLENGLSLLIFPEGHHTETGEIDRFRPGIGMIASRLDVPVVPVRLEGVERVRHRGWHMARPGHVRVTFGTAMHLTGGDYEGLARQVEEAVRALPSSSVRAAA